MTRRKFIWKLIKGGAAVITGAWCLAKKAAPRKFVRAMKIDKFPGLLKPFVNIKRESRWSG